MHIQNSLVSAEVEFDILDDIGGEGRNSEVYVVHDHQLDTELVAKQMPTKDFSSPNQYFAEARKLEDAAHPNVVPVRYAGLDEGDEDDDDDGHVYVVMPRYENGSLQGRMDDRTAQNELLTIREVVRFGLQFLTGLARIHSLDLVHFDIKPSNVLLDNSGMAVLADFGLAKYLGQFGAVDQPKAYKLHFAPERFRHRVFTPEIDIYQAGITLYRMTNGDRWFERQIADYTDPADPDVNALRQSILDGDFPDRDAYLPHVPNRLRRVINTALEVDPDDRYRTVREMMNELGRVRRYLDWQIEFDPNNQSYKGVLHEPSRQTPRTRTISVKPTGNEFDVEGVKEVNTPQTIRDWTQQGFQTFSDALSFVQSCIRSTDT
jgi:serine/threonine protein kinase